MFKPSSVFFFFFFFFFFTTADHSKALPLLQSSLFLCISYCDTAVLCYYCLFLISSFIVASKRLCIRPILGNFVYINFKVDCSLFFLLQLLNLG